MPSRPAKLAANLTRGYWHGIDRRHTFTCESAHRCGWTASVRDFSRRPRTVDPHAAGMDEAPAHSASQGRTFRLLRSCRGGGPYPHQVESAGSGIRIARYRAQSKRHSVGRFGPISLNRRRKSDAAAMTCETKPRFGWLRHPTPCGWRNERAFASATRRRSHERTR